MGSGEEDKEVTSFILWSGGKESYLSLLRARDQGLEVKYALSYIERRNRRLIGCYLREETIRRQVRTLGLEFVPVYGSRRKGDFEERLVEVLESLKDVEAGVFGDIRHTDHRRLLERVSRKVNIKPLFPLWGLEEDLILKEVLEVSRPLVVCRRVKVVPPKFLGGFLSEDLISYLKRSGRSITGEDGEYQTLVVEGKDISLSYSLGRRFRRSYYECVDVEVKDEGLCNGRDGLCGKVCGKEVT